MYNQPITYPTVSNQTGHTVIPPVYQHDQQTTSASSALGIRPDQLLPQMSEITRSDFQFDFEFERTLLAEIEKDGQYWTKLQPTEPRSTGPPVDPVVAKYIASGLSPEAVPLAVAQYGDNPTKIIDHEDHARFLGPLPYRSYPFCNLIGVKEFANGFALLQEMGFPSDNAADALLMYDNDTDKAVAYFLHSSS
ncbi:hypothetical protein ACFE04_027118 [Oxalis oulophora]